MKKSKAQVLLDLVKDIPEKKWIHGSFTDEKSKCCFLGHISRLSSDEPENYIFGNCCKLSPKSKKVLPNFKELNQITKYTEKFLVSKKSFNNSIMNINDGHLIKVGNKFSNKTYANIGPKKRVILFLEWMIAEGW